MDNDNEGRCFMADEIIAMLRKPEADTKMGKWA